MGFAWLGDGKGSERDGKRGGKRENFEVGEGCGVPASDEREAPPPQPRFSPT
jgi:hypothetical protein